jgi:hypothetical protein
MQVVTEFLVRKHPISGDQSREPLTLNAKRVLPSRFLFSFCQKPEVHLLTGSVKVHGIGRSLDFRSLLSHDNRGQFGNVSLGFLRNEITLSGPSGLKNKHVLDRALMTTGITSNHSLS